MDFVFIKRTWTLLWKQWQLFRQSFLQSDTDTYILSSCLRSWNAPLSITLIWLFSRCLWGKSTTSLSNQLQRLNFTSLSPPDWLKWQLKENQRTLAWLHFVTTANDKRKPFLVKAEADFFLIWWIAWLPRIRFQSACDILLWRLCRILGPLKFSRCITKRAHLPGYFLFRFASLPIKVNAHVSATNWYSALDNTGNP